MKNNTTLIALFFALLLSAIGQNSEAQNIKNDWTKDNLNGKVKSCKLVSFEVAPGLETIQKGDRKWPYSFQSDKKESYNEKGFKTITILYNPVSNAPSTLRYVYSYNDQGFIIEKNEKFDDQSNSYRFTYVYDDAGNLLEEYYYESDSIATTKYVYEYDEKGNRIGSKTYEPLDSLTHRRIFKYDGLQRRIETTLKDAENNILRKWWFTYDKNNNLIEQKEYSGSNESTTKTTFKYDKFGNTTETVFYDAEDEVELKFNYEYTYDTNGNWVKRVYSKNDVPSFILERIMEYYEN
jgi:YD repeat-containing protein